MQVSGEMLKKQKENKNKPVLITTFLSALLLVIYAVQLSVPVISDETVTMANAAWVTGRDWSLMIAHLGGLYYRFIQALMTVPFFYLFDDPDMIYRASMVLQALIQATTIPVVYLICRRHLKMDSPLLASLLGAAVCFVPSIALYVFYYRGDYLLSVLPWYVLLFFLEAMKAADGNRRARQIFDTIMAVLCCVAAYMAHTRGIVLIIALVITAVLVRIFLKRRSLHWPFCLLAVFVLLVADDRIGGTLKQALYSLSGVNANAFESTDMSVYLNLFSLRMIKDFILLCLSWLNTLVVTTEGLVMIGGVVLLVLAFRALFRKNTKMTDEEKTVALFAFLVFAGFYAVGALFFKGTYYALLTGQLKRRSDRLLYDRYAICGTGMLVFFALYALCCKRKWITKRMKLFCAAATLGVFGIFVWKFLPLATKYSAYIYNTITLNTFQSIPDPSKILSGAEYGKAALLAACLLGFLMMAAVLFFSEFKAGKMPYVVLAAVLICDLGLVQINYQKIRKPSNDYVKTATRDVVDFMQEFEGAVAEEFPYVLKGGLSGVKIQFYQSQLMDYKMFGKKQEKELNLDDYFILSKQGDIDLTWYEDDYYLFDDFDYENAQYDILYVKGSALAERMEELGYSMTKYQPEE